MQASKSRPRGVTFRTNSILTGQDPPRKIAAWKSVTKGNRFKNCVFYHFCIYGLDQRFSTLGSWRPTKQNSIQFDDPYTVLQLYN